ncbi:glycosyl transferase family 1 [Nitrospirillum amazonense]|uniref:Glycosyl transferase family 1 n=1 Tax=Nitrospirillum amazonense TaxID=28077 RepID=A0A560J9F4_9PROT|nr:glycosyltransferase [Nitrospirillum amazonense]TWB67818.1 glycosyl transferase family 1 [Nitrospirillum amazonense]
MAPDGSPLGLSRLMHFCHAADAGLRQQFNILEDGGRAAYMAWCLTGGFRHLGVDILTSGRNTPSLREPVTPAQKGHISPPDHAVALVGYAFGELGIGEDVRSMAAALRTADVPFGILDFPKGLAARQQDYTAAADVADHSTAPVTCFCLTGFDTGRYLVERGEARFRESYVVGYWPWELPHWPRPWSVAFELVDEVWVSSRFTQDALQLVSPVPVIYMPMCVRLAPPVLFDRSTLGAILGNFLFLYVFDANSYLERKNPAGVIAAFRRAFPTMTEPVGLVLKVMNAPPDSAAWEAVAEAARQDPRIRIIAMTTTRAEVLGLIEACDAYVSLHRSEGFGRTIAEAMLLERPVVATGWSGSDELITQDTALAVRSALIPVEPGAYPLADGTHWADPDLDHAAYCLRQTVQDSHGRAKRVAVARSRVEERHSAAAVGARYRERLNLIGQIINGKTAH